MFVKAVLGNMPFARSPIKAKKKSAVINRLFHKFDIETNALVYPLNAS
jgi:hypothetical protein